MTTRQQSRLLIIQKVLEEYDDAWERHSHTAERNGSRLGWAVLRHEFAGFSKDGEVIADVTDDVYQQMERDAKKDLDDKLNEIHKVYETLQLVITDALTDHDLWRG
jgi:hypothetical protein